MPKARMKISEFFYREHENARTYFFSARTFSLIQITALIGSLGGRLFTGTNTPFAMSSARMEAFLASISYYLTNTRP